MRSNSLKERLKQLQTKITQQSIIQKISFIPGHLMAFRLFLQAKVVQFDGRGLMRRLKALYIHLRQDFFYVDHKALAPYLGLLVITGFVFIGNQANQQAQAAAVGLEVIVSEVDPETVEKVLNTLDPLTPEIDETPEEVASLLVVAGDGGAVLPRPEMTTIAQAADSSKKDPIPYTVQKGDTMSSIARANGRSVATILEANGIVPEDAGKITPGLTLQIPQEDTSNSLAWLEADQKARAEAAKKRADQQAKLAAAKKKTGVILASAGATSRERSNESFSGNTGGNFIVPIHHNGISRGLGGGHTGIDYRANVGTAVVAAADGRIIEITHGWAGGWGNSIVIGHGGGWTTRYAHLSDTAVGVGDVVSQGDLIGYSGNTGRSTGPHLHFEARINNRPVQPF